MAPDEGEGQAAQAPEHGGAEGGQHEEGEVDGVEGADGRGVEHAGQRRPAWLPSIQLARAMAIGGAPVRAASSGLSTTARMATPMRVRFSR